jgi:DNA-binding NarL/FixJ family response regulator
VALSLTAFLRARTLVREAARSAKADHDQCEIAVASLREQLNGLATQLQEARREAASSSSCSVPRSGLNLTKRSQALRMQRRGDATAEIASTLGVPLQEVDLLLKVHRIVMSSV